MITCSNCKTTIEKNYCPECGQKLINHKISFIGIVEDFGNTFFSIERSLWQNVKMMVMNPQKIVVNYWSGFRNYFFSPNRFLLISALFLGINFLISKNRFLGVPFNPKNFSAQLYLLILLIPFLTISSYVTYRKFKKNLFEHLVLNSYSLSIWLIIFSILSIITYYLKLTSLEHPLLLVFLVLITAWNSRVFELSGKKRLFYTGLNILLFGSIIGSILYILIRIQYGR